MAGGVPTLASYPEVDRDRLAALCAGRRLTARQTAFVLAYVLDTGRSAVEAYRQAYTVTDAATAKWVLKEASCVLNRPAVRQMIREVEATIGPAVLERAIELTAISKARVMLELWRVAGADPLDLVVKPHTKVRALHLVGLELGMFQKTTTVKHEKVTPEQQAEREKARQRAFKLLEEMARGKVIDVTADPAPPVKPNGHGGNGTTNGSGHD